MTWESICPVESLLPDRGACARVGGVDVAVFRLSDGELLAVGNVDPYTGVGVMSRGIVGSRGDVDVVFSPLHKQAFCLRTGQSLDDEDVSLPVYPVRLVDGVVQIAA